jgi:AraC-like DNA-binding protein
MVLSAIYEEDFLGFSYGFRPGRGPHDAPDALSVVCNYIEAHLDDRLTLADLAVVACLSPYHFSRSFKQAVGVGLHHYVTQRRIERAKTPDAEDQAAPRLECSGDRLL